LSDGNDKPKIDEEHYRKITQSLSNDLCRRPSDRPKFELIVKDGKKKERQYFCAGCGNKASRTALFKIEGAVIVERYCDDCASKQI
jgi:hypothetical protein